MYTQAAKQVNKTRTFWPILLQTKEKYARPSTWTRRSRSWLAPPFFFRHLHEAINLPQSTINPLPTLKNPTPTPHLETQIQLLNRNTLLPNYICILPSFRNRNLKPIEILTIHYIPALSFFRETGLVSGLDFRAGKGGHGWLRWIDGGGIGEREWLSGPDGWISCQNWRLRRIRILGPSKLTNKRRRRIWSRSVYLVSVSPIFAWQRRLRLNSFPSIGGIGCKTPICFSQWPTTLMYRILTKNQWGYRPIRRITSLCL